MTRRAVRRERCEEHIIDGSAFDTTDSELIGEEAIETLDGSIGLRVIERCTRVRDAERLEELFELGGDELLSVVADYSLRQAPSRKQLFEKRDDCRRGDSVHGANFGPLRVEVIHND